MKEVFSSVAPQHATSNLESQSTSFANLCEQISQSTDIWNSSKGPNQETSVTYVPVFCS